MVKKISSKKLTKKSVNKKNKKKIIGGKVSVTKEYIPLSNKYVIFILSEIIQSNNGYQVKDIGLFNRMSNLSASYRVRFNSQKMVHIQYTDVENYKYDKHSIKVDKDIQIDLNKSFLVENQLFFSKSAINEDAIRSSNILNYDQNKCEN